jgi:hypothetical protein
MRNVEVQVISRAWWCKHRFALRTVGQFDGFGLNAKPLRKQPAQRCARDGEAAAVAFERKPVCAALFVFRKYRAECWNTAGRNVEPRDFNVGRAG